MKYMDFYNIISQYYPIGINEFDPNYSEYVGLIKLQQMQLNKMEPGKLSYEWNHFVNSFTQEFSELISLSHESSLLDNSYTGRFTIYNKKGNISHCQQLFFHLSILGSFFTIYGKDTVIINSKEGFKTIFDPVIIIEPIEIYRRYFLYVRQRIEEVFKAYKFLPFIDLRQRIAGLSVTGAIVKEGQSSSVFQAFFTHENITDYQFKGDLKYA